MAEIDPGPLRVVVADDAPQSRALLLAILQGMTGVEVVSEAADGRQAVEAVIEQGADLVFLDIAMPVMDGLAAAAAIRAGAPDVKIAMYSADNRTRMGSAAREAGADCYVQKAVTSRELLQQLQTMFPGRVGVRAPAAPVEALAEVGAGEVRAALADERYCGLLDALEEGVLVVDDAEGRVIAANYAATQILEVPTSRLLGHTLAELGYAGTLVESAKVGEAVAAGRPVSNPESTLVRPYATTAWLLAGVRLLPHPTRPGRREVLVCFLDLTAHRRAEQEHAAGEQRLRDTFEALLDGVVVFSAVRDEHGRAVDVRCEDINEEGCRLISASRQELIGQRLDLVRPWHRKAGLVDLYLQVLETGEPAVLSAFPVVAEWGPRGGQTRLFDIRVVRSGTTLVASYREVTEQARMHDALRDREERLGVAVESLREGFYVMRSRRDEAGRIVDFEYEMVNPAGCRLIGRSERELVGRGLLEVLPDHDRLGLFDRYRRVVETGNPYFATATYDADGVPAGSYAFSATKAGDGFVVTVEDVTERRRQQRELAASEQRFRQLLETTHEGVLISDAHHVITHANPQAGTLFGYPQEELVGMPVVELTGPQSRADVEAGLQAHRSGSGVGTQELQCRRKDGSVWWARLSATPLYDSDGTFTGAFGMFADITERKEVELALRTSEERLRAAVASMTEAFFLTRARRDGNGTITDLEYVTVNDTACRFLGRRPEDLIGHGVLELYPGHRTSGLFDAYKRVVETGEPFHEVIEYRGEGVEGTFEVSVTKAGDGNLMVGTDVTQRRRREQELNQAVRDLEAFASALSHDLREPVLTTTGFAQLLHDQHAAALPAEGQKYLGYVLDGTARMNERISAILDFARSGAAAAPAHPVDVGPVVQAALTDLAGVLADTHAEVQVDALPTVAADGLQLQRVFQNLIGNAAKYHHPDTPARIHVTAEPQDGCWQFSVIDNGSGVPEADRERIFRMFARGASQVTDGHGMGLALSRRIIESYGGRIWVEDNPDGGSRFCFILPITG